LKIYFEKYGAVTLSSKMFLKGKIRLMNNNRTVVLSFYSKEILKQFSNKKVTASAIFDETTSEVVIKPSNTKTRFFSDGRYAVCLAVTKCVPRGVVTPLNRYKRIKVIVDPLDFGLHEEDLIEDDDGRLLFICLKEKGFKLNPIISTCNNKKGDLSVRRDAESFSIHITRYNPKTNTPDKKLKLRHYLLGRIAFQCYQALSQEDAKCYAVLNSDLCFTKVITSESVDFLKSNRINLIFTDFKENWEHEVAGKIMPTEKSVSSK
jgi:hypothetical protein